MFLWQPLATPRDRNNKRRRGFREIKSHFLPLADQRARAQPGSCGAVKQLCGQGTAGSSPNRTHHCTMAVRALWNKCSEVAKEPHSTHSTKSQIHYLKMLHFWKWSQMEKFKQSLHPWHALQKYMQPHWKKKGWKIIWKIILVHICWRITTTWLHFYS